MYTVDATLFLGDLDTHHAEHAACHAVLEYIHSSATPVVVPLLLLAEVASVLSQELHDPKRARLAVSLIRSMQHVRLVGLNDGLAQDSVEIAADYELSAGDAVYVAVARHYATTLVTLNRRVRERVARAVPVYTPEELLSSIA